MAVFEITMKTHSCLDISKDFLFVHNCKKHGVKPNIYDIVAGKRKEHHYVVTCESEDECSVLAMESAKQAVEVWNNINPVTSNPSGG